MDKEKLIKDIVKVGQEANKDSEKIQSILFSLKAAFTDCEQCKLDHTGDVFWVIEELRTGFLSKKTTFNVFSVCSLKCLLDHKLNSKAYYSIVVSLANGEIVSTGFQGLNAMALGEFANLLSTKN